MGLGKGSKATGVGAQAKSGMAGMPTGASPSTGPNPGLGAGQRPPGTPEDTTFQRDKVGASGLDPRGQSVGTLLTEGPSEAGEVTIQKGGAVEKAARQLSEEVEREPLPVERREEVQRFLDSLVGGKSGSVGGESRGEEK